MALALVSGSLSRHVQQRTGPGSPQRSSRAVAGALARPQSVAAPSPLPEVLQGSSNIVAVPGGLSEGQRRKLELQAAAQAALEAENSWWQEQGPSNLVAATTPKEYKRLITSAPRDQLVIVDYLKPGCAGCRRLFPKLKQLAETNPDALFIKVNVELPEMRELGRGMHVTQLPWFHLFRGGDIVASFSANVTTVATLRAEIAANKPCVHPDCSVY